MGELIRLEGVLLSCDAEVVSVMNQVLDSFEIEAEVCQEPQAALKAISQRKLDTVIVDWDRRDEPDRVLSALRTSEPSSWGTNATASSAAVRAAAARMRLREGFTESADVQRAAKLAGCSIPYSAFTLPT